MVEITSFLEQFLQALNESFGERVWFAGIQGSFARNEATETSDIDIVVILDVLSSEDITVYSSMLNKLPHRNLICGFLSGLRELMNWEPSDLFQFYNDTRPLKGSLDDLLPLIDADAVDRAIKIGTCNIYHGCVHNMLHEKSEEILKGLYKSASFVIQAICFKQTGQYINRLNDLYTVVSPDDQAVLENCLRIKNGSAVDFDSLSEVLFFWAGKLI